MTETWRSIPGYEGVYEVSDLGRMRSLDRVTDRGRRWRGRIMSPSPMQNGYMIVTLWRDGKQRTRLLHRLVLTAFVGEPPEGFEGLHRDSDKTNNAPANLAWGTHSENQFDQVMHGTHPNASKGQCPSGHKYDEKNTYIYPGKPHRACRQCRRDYSRWYQRQLRARRASKEMAA